MAINISLNDLLVIFSVIGGLVTAFKFILIPFSNYIKENAINKYEMESMKKDILDHENRIKELEKNN